MFESLTFRLPCMLFAGQTVSMSQLSTLIEWMDLGRLTAVMQLSLIGMIAIKYGQDVDLAFTLTTIVFVAFNKVIHLMNSFLQYDHANSGLHSSILCLVLWTLAPSCSSPTSQGIAADGSFFSALDGC